ncbi:hypothetical protein JCM1840_006439 [Sporobolomyces johnsonii]
MSLRSQRPQNPPPPSNSDAYSNYRPQVHSPPLRSNSNGTSSPAPPSASASASASASSSTTGAPGKPPPLTLEQSKAVARTHYDALKRWLTREGALANASTRTNAREKLTRLTRQQFQELSTDVYDELVRRMEDAAGRPGEQPFLAVRPDFHPKRNQARQKLATLPLQRFRDLASDVYFELDRRYPEFGEEDQRTAESHSRSASLSSAANHSNLASPVPPPNLNAQRRAPTPNSSHSHSASPSVNAPPAAPNSNDVVVPNKSTMVVEEPSGGFNASSSSAPSRDDHRPGSAADDRSLSPNLQSGAPSSFNFGSGGKPYLSSSNEHDRKEENVERQPSPAGGARPGQGQGHQSRASEASSIGTSKFFGGYAGSTGASEAGGRRSWDYEDRSQLEKQKADYEYKLTMLQNRVQELERENEDAATAMKGRQGEQGRVRDLEAQLRNQRERFDDQSAQLRSLQRDHDTLLQQQRSFGSPSLSSGSSVADVARLRSDLASAEDLANELRGEVSSLVDELRMVNERSDELQAELERERAEKEEQKREAREWKERWQAAKTELRNIKATSQLFTSSISVDNDYMPASPDGLINDSSVAAFQTSIDDLLQAARSKEPSSVLPAARAVVSACAKIDSDVQSISPARLASLPLADQDTVNALKAKINATLSNLMTASKNHAMSFGVSPVSLLDAAASHLAATIVELVRILKIRRTSSGGRFSVDPSAAGIGRQPYAHDRMPPLPEQPLRDSSPNMPPPVPLVKPNGDLSGGMSNKEGGEGGPAEDSRGMIVQSPQSEYGLQQQQDQARTYAGESSWDRQPPQQQQEQYGGSYENGTYGSPSIQQHGQGSFDQGQQYGGDEYGQSPREDDPYGQAQQQHRGDEDRYGAEEQYSSPGLRGSDRDPEELRAYIENQTEAIVHSIQSLLSAIRSGAQGSQLTENLTQIITIVSSIVAISKEALPDHSRHEGDAILQDLTDHCDKLSEMQSQSDGGAGHQGAAFTKQTKQAMASASFGVAKSLKQLNGLLSSGAGEEGLV